MGRRGDEVQAVAAASLALLAAPVDAQRATPRHAPTAMTSPAPFWQNVTGVGVTCLVRTPAGVDSGERHRTLCETVRRRAAIGAPVPVTMAALGGEALRPGRVTLLVQARIAPIGGEPVMALSIRPFRNLADDAGPLFAASPQAIPADDASALDTAIRTMLAETLPWQATT